MRQEELDDFLEERFEIIRSVLASKGYEYTVEDDDSRFHNFNMAASFNNETPERALWGMLTKHLVSLSDMVQRDSEEFPLYVWDEKIGDAVNYMLLLWAMTHHHRDLYENMVGHSPAHHLGYGSNLTPLNVEFHE